METQTDLFSDAEPRRRDRSANRSPRL